MKQLLSEIRSCTACARHLPYNPQPIVQASSSARIIIIGQAPGIKVQQTGIPWNDASGKKLREWLGASEADFYDPKKFALMPMGFCYPGKGKSGDLPPRPECAPLWHARLLAAMKKARLVILIGQYAQDHYLDKKPGQTLTARVREFSDSLHKKKSPVLIRPAMFPLPHPSPRNRFWLSSNKWFENETLPLLRKKVTAALGGV